MFLCVLIGAFFATGPIQLFSIGAVAAGLLVATVTAFARWMRGVRVTDVLALGALSSLVAHGIADLRRTK
jgi:hypothetical protein